MINLSDIYNTGGGTISGGGVPVGSVIPFIGGYFTNGTNGGFTSVLGNTVAAVNTLVNESGWYACDGAALNKPDSPIFSGTGRYLPNLTDDRFIMGDLSSGVVGGANTMAHTHSVDIASFTSGATTLTISQMPAHTHTNGVGSAATWHTGGANAAAGSTTTGSTGGNGSHTHAVNPPATTSAEASNTENRPNFLSAIYIMKVV